MKKGIAIILCLCMLLSVLPLCTGAAENTASVNFTSAYCAGKNLYTFVDASDLSRNDIYKTKVGIYVNSFNYGKQNLVNRVAQTDTRVCYMLLIDLSTSMAKYRSAIKAFADSLVQETANDYSIQIASLGEEFSLVAENLADAASVGRAVDNLQYTQQRTDIVSGIEGAVNHLMSQSRKNGDLVNLVLVTDGIEYSSSSNQNQADKIQAIIDETPEIVVHSLCFGSFDQIVADVLSRATGKSLYAASASSAAQAGEGVADFINNTYRLDCGVSISANARNFDVDYHIATAGEKYDKIISLKNVVNFDVQENTGQKTKPSEAQSEQETTEKETKEQPQTSETTKEEEPEKKVLTKGQKIAIIGACAAAALLAVIITLIVIRRKKLAAANSLPLSLEIISGEMKKSNYLLKDTLEIGNAPKADISLAESGALIRAVITRREGEVYIENLSEETKVSINGMKIYSKNPLRDGDTVRIGNTEFIVHFHQ